LQLISQNNEFLDVNELTATGFIIFLAHSRVDKYRFFF